MKSIGKLIQTRREEKALSREELGKMLSVSEQTVECWERNKAFPDNDTFQRLLALLELSPTVVLIESLRKTYSTRKKWIITTASFLVTLATVLSVSFVLVPWLKYEQYQNLIEEGYEFADNRGGKNVSNQYAEDATMVELIATPERYHGKLVRVIGVGNLEFEGDCILLSKDEQKYRGDHRIWISFCDRAITYEEAQALNGKYVIVEGIFNMYDTGHMGMFQGAIEDVSRYELWWGEDHAAIGE